MDIKIIGYNCSNGIKLKKNIEHTSFIDKAKTAFPIALTSSILTLALYFLT